MLASPSVRPDRSHLGAKTDRPTPRTSAWVTPALSRRNWPRVDLPPAAFRNLDVPPRPHRELPADATEYSPLPPLRPRRLPAPSVRCARYRLGTLRGRCSYCLSLAVQRFSSEVVEGEGEESEHDDADQVVVQRIVVAETGDRAVGGGFVEFGADTEEADDASGSDEARRVEAA